MKQLFRDNIGQSSFESRRTNIFDASLSPLTRAETSHGDKGTAVNVHIDAEHYRVAMEDGLHQSMLYNTDLQITQYVDESSDSSFFQTGNLLEGLDESTAENTTGLTFFGANGTELWVTDRTNGGTQLVKDLGVSFGKYLETVNGVAFFTVHTGSSYQVWRSDGTAAGTFGVSGNLTNQVETYNVAVMGGSLYYLANHPSSGTSLFRVSETDASAHFVALARDTMYSNPELIATASQVFFVGRDSFGPELWATNGTAGGTIRLTNFALDVNWQFERFGESVIFVSNEGSNSRNPWISDGTIAGTTPLFANFSSPNTTMIKTVGDLVYSYTFYLGQNGFVNTLHVSNGTPNGVPTDITLPGQILNTAVIGGQLFVYVSGSVGEPKLLKIEGNAAVQVASFWSGGTTYAVDLGDRMVIYAYGPAGTGYYSYDGTSMRLFYATANYNAASDFTVSEGKLYFIMSPGNGTSYLMVNDGVSPTRTITSTAQGGLSLATDIEAVAGGVIFSASRADVGTELFFTNGSSNTATLLADLAPGMDYSADSTINWSSSLPNGEYLFGMSNAANGFEPWVTDGTIAGTHLLADLVPGASGSNFSNPIEFAGWTYFHTQVDAFQLPRLWATNGTTTVNLGTITTGLSYTAFFSGKLYYFGGSNWLEIAPANGTPVAADVRQITPPSTIWFPQHAEVNGTLVVGGSGGVWAFDGTSFTRLANSSPGEMVSANGVIYLGVRGTLYQTDGSVAGTVALFTSPNFPSLSNLRLLDNGTLVFTNPFGDAVWVKDASGVRQLMDFNPSGSDGVTGLSVVGNTMYFTAKSPAGVVNLWSSDGTAANTQIVDTSALGPFRGTSNGFAFGGNMFMVLWGDDGGIAVRIDAATNAITVLGTGLDTSFQTVADGAGHFYFLTGTGLFLSDGTVAGTVMLLPTEDFDSGKIVDGLFYFTATTEGQGSELWRSDGTVAGTIMLTNGFVMNSSSPGGFGTISNHAPEAVADLAAVNAGAMVSASTRSTGVLGNDADPDFAVNTSLAVTAARAGSGSSNTVPSSGSLVLNGTYGDLSLAADGSWTYSANSAAALALRVGVHANDVFTYTVVDNLGATSSATLTIGVAGTNTSLIGTLGNDRIEIGPVNSGVAVDGLAGFDTLAVTGTVDLTAGSLASIEALEFTTGAALILTGTQSRTGLASNTVLSGTGTLTVNMDVPGNFISKLFTFSGSGVSLIVNGTNGSDIFKLGNGVHTVNAGDGTDQIKGGNAADTINGGAGIDKINGASGADILTGGTGNDVFKYAKITDSGIGAAADQITDFVIGSDRLNFVKLDANATLAGDQAFGFVGTGAFTGGGVGSIRYQDTGSNLLVQVDVDGNGTADMEIILQGLTGQTLTGGDFVL